MKLTKEDYEYYDWIERGCPMQDYDALEEQESQRRQRDDASFIILVFLVMFIVWIFN